MVFGAVTTMGGRQCTTTAATHSSILRIISHSVGELSLGTSTVLCTRTPTCHWMITVPPTSNTNCTCGISSIFCRVCAGYQSQYHDRNSHHAVDEPSLRHFQCSQGEKFTQGTCLCSRKGMSIRLSKNTVRGTSTVLETRTSCECLSLLPKTNVHQHVGEWSQYALWVPVSDAKKEHQKTCQRTESEAHPRELRICHRMNTGTSTTLRNWICSAFIHTRTAGTCQASSHRHLTARRYRPTVGAFPRQPRLKGHIR